MMLFCVNHNGLGLCLAFAFDTSARVDGRMTEKCLSECKLQTATQFALALGRMTSSQR